MPRHEDHRSRFASLTGEIKMERRPAAAVPATPLQCAQKRLYITAGVPSFVMHELTEVPIVFLATSESHWSRCHLQKEQRHIRLQTVVEMTAAIQTGHSLSFSGF